MSFRSKKRICFLLLLLLVFLIFLPWRLQQKKQPEGSAVVKEDILTYHRLMNLLMQEGSEKEKQQVIKEAELLASSWKEEQITYGEWKKWFSKIEEGFDLFSREEEEKLEKKYARHTLVLKEDVDLFLGKLWEILDEKGEISYQNLVFLGDSSNVTDLEGNPIEKELVFTDNGKWRWEVRGQELPVGKELYCLTFREGIWSGVEARKEATLKNAWIVENSKERFICFYNNYYIDYDNLSLLQEDREQVADIIFSEGKPQQLLFKTKKLSGKVVKVTDTEIELMEEGSYPLSEEIQYYQLNGPLKNVGRNEIPLGYNFTDFIIEDGKIQAALLVKDEKMENIRVLLKTPDYAGYFHPEIQFYAEVDLEIVSGGKKETIPAGQRVELTPESWYFENKRIYLQPKALTGRTYFPELNRNNKGQGYFGSFEIEKREEGLLLINEVLLEEYLYAVVPSEMPGYYPMEALKAQAISARTYAYQRMKIPGLSSYGANLDDSSTYQVYNNISENSNTTRAVRETKGKLLYAGNQPASTYYYSTSCGFGTDASIWEKSGENPYDYLQSREMLVGEGGKGEDLKREEAFEAFITSHKEVHFESKEAWYRWSYGHGNMEVVKEKAEARLQEYPDYAVFYPENEGEVFRAEDAKILEIEVKERKAGGAIDCLWIHTDQGVIEIRNEYHVRAVLADGKTLVQLQDGTTYACNQLLPSAFFCMRVEKEEEEIKTIRLLGGGFGHGVGMSQNGAKNLADLGYEAEEILTYYYQGCQVREQEET